MDKVVRESVRGEEFESGSDNEYEGQEDQKENPFANRNTVEDIVRNAHEKLHNSWTKKGSGKSNSRNEKGSWCRRNN